MASVLAEYLDWHYRRGIKDSLVFSTNVLWFVWNFFSIGLLLKTLFAPFQRLQEHGSKGNLQSYFEAFIITTFMRLVGAFIRLIFIGLGLILSAGAYILLFIFEIVWLLLPVAVVVSFIFGIIVILT